MVKQMVLVTDKTQLRRQCDRIIEKLRHVQAYLMQQERGESLQHAMRIVQSRIRLIDRAFALAYGTKKEQTLARIEFQLGLDDGTVVEIHNRKHGRGRFGCLACDPNPRNMLEKLNRLCPSCKKGIQHSFTLYDEVGVVVTPGEGEPISYNQNKGDQRVLIKQYYQCETCGTRELIR